MANNITIDGRELRIVQHNMRGAQVVSLEMRKVMNEEDFDILLMQEPYNVKGRLLGFGGCLTVTGGNHRRT